MNQVYQQVWIALPKEKRQHLMKVFNIKPTGVTEVRDQTLISDGMTNDDLKFITLERMCEYIGSQETFMRAWEITLAKCHSELNPPMGVIEKVGGNDIQEVVPNDEGSVTVKVEKELEILKEKVDNTTIEVTISDIKPKITFTPEELPLESKRFCDKCASKGVRHYNGCPNKTF